MHQKQVRIIIIIICLVVLTTSGAGSNLFFPLSTFQAYTTGYQGAHARFCGVAYPTATDGVGGLGHYQDSLWGTTFAWDIDERGSGKPAIAGEMTSVFVPAESVGRVTSHFRSGADISSWLLESTERQNPVEAYEWELEDAEGITHVYRMEEWVLKWYFSISAEPQGVEIPVMWVPPDIRRNSLQDVQVWFEFDLTPIWYFENQTRSYFAIASLQISDIELGGKLNNEDYETTYNTDMRTLPMSEHTPFTLYHGIFGTSANRAEKDAYDYEGKRLNPDLFTDKVYAYLTLQDFGVTAWVPWSFGTVYRADAVTVGCDMHVFVVGEWAVKDVQDVPDDYGRTAKVGTSGSGGIAVSFGEALQAFLTNPQAQLWAFIGLIALIVLGLAIVAPSLLFSLFGVVRRRGSRK